MSESNKRARTAEGESKEVTKAEKYHDEDGDLEIVSSDGVTFRVHAYVLQAASQVFRNMIKIGVLESNKVVELGDKDLESSGNLTEVLDYLTESWSIEDYEVPEAILVILFMKKFGMDREIDRVCLQLTAALMNHSSVFKVWILATVAENYELAGKAIESYDGEQYEKELLVDRREIYGEHVDRGSTLDVTTWGIEDYRLVPEEARWALGRASREVGSFDRGRTESNYKAMGAEYVRLMKLPRGNTEIRWIRRRGGVIGYIRGEGD